MLEISLTNASGLRYQGRDRILQGARTALVKEGIKHGVVDYILVDNKAIKKLHKEWFNDGSVTDVITFPIVEEPPIEAEVYISVETAKVNAERFGVTLTNELCRLAVHGALHIAGYDDATDEQRQRMHERENRYLSSL